jgi:hypothetical protein
MPNKLTNPVQAHSPQTSAFTLFIGRLQNHFTLLPDLRKGKNIVADDARVHQSPRE